MKLYATVTSERASKGQGGNKKIELDIFDLNKAKIIEGTLTPEIDGYSIYITTLTMGEENQCIDIKIPYSKGKRQKDEVCNYCGTKRGSNKQCDPNNAALKHSYE